MQFEEVLLSRRSIREFSSKPVSAEQIDALLKLALDSPSWSNTQPYKIAVATGDILEDLRVVLPEKFRQVNRLRRAGPVDKLKALVKGGVLPDGDFKPILDYPPDLQPRRQQTGFGLYQQLGIERHDHEARDAQMAKNFSFFNAPVALFVFVHEGLGAYSALDAGIFLQSLMLAAQDQGLGTCAQGALALWRSPLENHFQIPKQYKLICGVSLGYPEEAKVNQYKPDRRSLDELKVAPLR